MGHLARYFGGLFIDAFLKIRNPKIDWGFSKEKNPTLCSFAGLSLWVIPIVIHNKMSFKYLFIPFFVSFLLAILIYLFYIDLPKPKKEEIIHYNDNDILDDEFTKK